MLIILEGANGVGKSTYAKILTNELNIPVFRPFYMGNKIHLTNVNSQKQEQQKKLLRFGVELNIHIEDLFAADFFAMTQASAILDRSLPSSIAYGQIGSGKWDVIYKNKSACQELLELWEGMIAKAHQPILYVWLNCEHEIATKRGDGWKPNKAQRQKLDKVFFDLFTRIKLPKMRINTGVVEKREGVKSIIRKVVKNVFAEKF